MAWPAVKIQQSQIKTNNRRVVMNRVSNVVRNREHFLLLTFRAQADVAALKVLNFLFNGIVLRILIFHLKRIAAMTLARC